MLTLITKGGKHDIESGCGVFLSAQSANKVFPKVWIVQRNIVRTHLGQGIPERFVNVEFVQDVSGAAARYRIAKVSDIRCEIPGDEDLFARLDLVPVGQNVIKTFLEVGKVRRADDRFVFQTVGAVDPLHSGEHGQRVVFPLVRGFRHPYVFLVDLDVYLLAGFPMHLPAEMGFQ